MTDDQTLLDLAGRATPRPWPVSRDGVSIDVHLEKYKTTRPYFHIRDNAAYASAACNEVPRLISEKRSEAARADLTGFMLAWVVAAIRPAQPPRKPYVFHSLSACAGCGCSGDDFGSVNVEAFEMTGELYCDDCADEAIENASQGDDE